MKSDNPSELVIGGLYEHYKGKPYRVHGVVRHSETLEELVLYETLYENDLGKLWVRPKAMFLESVELNGASVPRFRFIYNKTLAATDSSPEAELKSCSHSAVEAGHAKPR